MTEVGREIEIGVVLHRVVVVDVALLLEHTACRCDILLVTGDIAVGIACDIEADIAVGKRLQQHGCRVIERSLRETCKHTVRLENAEIGTA